MSKKLSGDAVLTKLETTLQSRLVGIDPMTIAAIIMAIISAVMWCRKQSKGKVTPELVREAARRRGPLARLRLRRALRQEGVHRKHEERTVETVLDVAAQASDTELAAFLAECHD